MHTWNCNCFWCIFDQINAALVSMRDVFRKHSKSFDFKCIHIKLNLSNNHPHLSDQCFSILSLSAPHGDSDKEGEATGGRGRAKNRQWSVKAGGGALWVPERDRQPTASLCAHQQRWGEFQSSVSGRVFIYIVHWAHPATTSKHSWK